MDATTSNTLWIDRAGDLPKYIRKAKAVFVWQTFSRKTAST
jgi:hypothetical protein